MAGTLIVSLDFELFWGMLDVCPLEDYQDNVLGGRRAIPRLLRLFREHGIHATWAAVGFLFADSKQEAQKYFPQDRPAYENEKLSPYPWFDRIGDNEDQAPCFFAPSLLRMVADTRGRKSAATPSATITAGRRARTWQPFGRIWRPQRPSPGTTATM